MSGKHLQGLDGLRGVAILLIVLYHVFPHRGVGLFGYLISGAWCGVDLFFVLSGFLITGILFDTQSSSFFLSNFYIRRSLRLFPVYFAFIAIVILLPHQPTGHSGWVNFLFVAFGSNIVLSFVPGFHFGLPLVTGHIWSLAVEQQFYLIWPVLVLLLKTRRNILIACLTGSLTALLLRIVCAHFLPTSLWFLYFQLPTRADSLLLGGAAAMLYRTPNFLALHLPKVRLAGFLAALAFLALAFHSHTFYFAATPINTWGYSLLAIASASLVLLAVAPSSVSGRLLDNPILRFYGRYSYGLYLIHQAPSGYYDRYLIPFATAHVHPFWLAATLYFLSILAVSTALAVLSFRFIERPFLRLKKLVPIPQAAAPVPAFTHAPALYRVS